MVKEAELEALALIGMLLALMEAREWLVPGEEEFPRPPAGYVISHVAFHERGFSVSAVNFIHGVLHHYRLELQHLTPNGVLHIAVFAAPCEGFLGINPHWELFKYYFSFKINAAKVGGSRHYASIGSASLQMKLGWAQDYIELPLVSSNSGWHPAWSYLKNDRRPDDRRGGAQLEVGPGGEDAVEDRGRRPSYQGPP